MQTKTFQISPGGVEKILMRVPSKVRVSLNRDDNEVWVSTEPNMEMASSFLIRAADSPVDFSHTGNLYLWVSRGQEKVVGVSVIVEPEQYQAPQVTREETRTSLSRVPYRRGR